MGERVQIVIIDDDEIDIRATKKALLNAKISNPIATAGDGVEGLELLRSGTVPGPWLILLDWKMPRMTGDEFLTELRHDDQLKRAVVFVLTTSDHDQDKLAAYDHHVAGYLLKSNVAEGFVNHVHMLDRFLVSVEFPPAA